jgi:hypothetical protein
VVANPFFGVRRSFRDCLPYGLQRCLDRFVVEGCDVVVDILEFLLYWHEILSTRVA